MEQGTGIEPAFTAWEAVVLPIYEPCVKPYYSKPICKNQPLFVGWTKKNMPPVGRHADYESNASR